MRRLLISLCVVSSALLAGGDAESAAPARVGYAWPLPTCVACAGPLGTTPIVRVLVDAKDPSIQGREVRFCQESCIATFDANRPKYLKAADATIEVQEMPSYPRIHCIVMPDEALPDPNSPDADEAKTVVVGNQLVRVCCAQCVRKVKRNPTLHLAALQNAFSISQPRTDATQRCPTCGKDLPTTPVETLIAGRLVRVCCDGCKASAEKSPAATLAKMDQATKNPK